MRYFSGFCFRNEKSIFEKFLIQSDTTVAGFSYGACKAFEYAYYTTNRVDRLILLSPAFFQEHKKSFIRTQLRYFTTDKDLYIQNFINNVIYPSHIDISPYFHTGTQEQLQELLEYKWDISKLQELKQRGVSIEVFLGEKDKIVDTTKSTKFFAQVSTVYTIKDVGHILSD